MIVDISKVIPLGDDTFPFGVRKMKAVLMKQGQIEPLQVYKLDDNYLVFHDDPWGNEIIYAARELGWKTLLIVEMKRYES